MATQTKRLLAFGDHLYFSITAWWRSALNRDFNQDWADAVMTRLGDGAWESRVIEIDDRRLEVRTHDTAGWQVEEFLGPAPDLTLPEPVLDQDTGMWIASCPEIDHITSGLTSEQAMINIRKIASLWLRYHRYQLQ